MGFIKDTFDTLTGKTAARAAEQAGVIQQQATGEGILATEEARERGLGFLQPFQQIGQAGIEQAGFLTDPQAQFDFLQQNPLFQAALEQAQTGTQNIAAARGRLSAGDTLQQLSQNVLLSASPLIQQQKASIADLLNVGTGVAGQQANIATGAGADISNLITSGGAARAAGEVGAASARGAGLGNLINVGGLIAGSGLFESAPATSTGSLGQSVFSGLPSSGADFGSPSFKIAGIT